MFKKISTVLLAVLMLSLCACGGKGGESGSKNYDDEVDATKANFSISQYAPKVEGHLTEAPNYSLPADATEDEARAMAVTAMNDELTFKWVPAQSFQYKETAGASRNLVYDMTQVYGGIPYNNKARSLFHCLDWYDYETGYMYDLDFNNGNLNFGNTCANSVIWGLSAVCPNVTATSTHTVCPGGGFAFVGDVQPHDDVQKFTGAFGTDTVIAELGEQGLYESYAMAKPADATLRHRCDEDGNHCQMVVDVHTVRKEDGTIDPDASTLDIQDQWGKIYMENGVGYCGRHKTFTFSEMKEDDYIILRPVDFVDYKGHEVANLEIFKEASTYADLKSTKVQCNYRITGIYGSLISESGTTVAYKKCENTNYKGSINVISGVPSASDMLAVMRQGRNYTIKVEVRLADGELLTVSEVPVTIAELEK